MLRFIQVARIVSSIVFGICTAILLFFAWRARSFVEVTSANIAYAGWATLFILTLLLILVDSILVRHHKPVRSWSLAWRLLWNLLLILYIGGLALIGFLHARPWELEYLQAARKCGDIHAERVEQHRQASGQCGAFPDFETCYLEQGLDHHAKTYIHDMNTKKVDSSCIISFQFKLFQKCFRDSRKIDKLYTWYCQPDSGLPDLEIR